MSDKLQWWGYLHSNGSIQAKRYFDSQDIEEALESPFCSMVFGPFECLDRNEALTILKEKVDGIQKKNI